MREKMGWSVQDVDRRNEVPLVTTEATPLSPGIVTFLHSSPLHSKAAPTASEIKVHGKGGGGGFKYFD